MRAQDLIRTATRRLWLEAQPISATGKRLTGVNARRRRQARFRRDAQLGLQAINRLMETVFAAPDGSVADPKCIVAPAKMFPATTGATVIATDDHSAQRSERLDSERSAEEKSS